MTTTDNRTTAGIPAGKSPEKSPGRPRRRAERVLGANFNEDPDSVTFGELRDLSASWIRGFVPMPEVTGDASQQRAVKMLLAARRQDFGTVLSLKFPFNHRPVPRPGGPAMAAELARVDRVLKAVLDTVDVLVIGNEPFIESRPRTLDRAPRTRSTKRSRRTSSPIGSGISLGLPHPSPHGALNHLEQPEKRTKATARWLSFARGNPAIDGVDIHPTWPRRRMSKRTSTMCFLGSVRTRSSWSPSSPWSGSGSSTGGRRARRVRPPSRSFARHPGLGGGQGGDRAPVPEREWRDFLSACPWFEDNKRFVRDQVRRFRDTGRLAVATYGVTQGAAMTRDFGPDKQPWLLNSLYANRTVEPTRDGLPAHGYGFFDDFRALQRTRDRRPVRAARVAT
ncbi:hypothetical protein NKH77_30040 [Streptomyces sp. M19]